MVNPAFTYPNDGDFVPGQDFNYEFWTPGTTVTLCNVRWDSDYRNTVRFDSPMALDKHIDSGDTNSVKISGNTYARAGSPIRLSIPFNQAYRYNYMRVTNPGQIGTSEGARTFYYFIQDVVHIAPNTTQFNIQLDVWQTFISFVNVAGGYCERGHIGIAHGYGPESLTGKGNLFNDNTHLTVPEGLDLGNEYVIYNHSKHTIAQPPKSPTALDSYHVFITSTTDLTKDGGTVSNPKLNTASGSLLEGLPNGCDVYRVQTLTAFTKLMKALSDKPWQTQGIISVQAIPAGISKLYSGAFPVTVGGQQIERMEGFTWASNPPNKRFITLETNFRDKLYPFRMPIRYRFLTKFRTYPYSFVELTCNTGTPIVLKPECVNSDNLVVTEISHISQPSPRIAYFPTEYNRASDNQTARTLEEDGGENYSMMTGFFNFPTFSIVNDGYLSVMASQSNTISYQNQSADWSQQKALGGNQLSYDQAGKAMGAESQNTAITNNTANAQWAVGAAQGVLNGAIGGGKAGPLGALAGAGMGALNAGADGARTALSNHANNQRLAVSQDVQGYNRDTNKALADWAAKGDYQNQIAAINARVQDAKLTQPSVSGQVGGDAFMLVAKGMELVAKYKGLTVSSMNLIGDYWLRYGYAIQRWINMPNMFKCMTKFTYWKMSEVYLTSADCPEVYKQSIRGIFEKGVTVWVNPNDIGMYRATLDSNEPIYNNYLEQN